MTQPLDGLIRWATNLSRRDAWWVTSLAFAVAATGDWLTGPDIWFGPLYLFIICLPTWSLGARAGIITGLACFVINALSNGLNTYPAGDVALVWSVTMRLASIAMVLALVAGFRRSYDREWRNARVDQVTGALTRQGFFEHLESLGGRGRCGVLAYIDLDDFKRVNDRYGHAAGDEVLRLFAGEIRTSIGPDDSVARIGGDEFLLYLATDDEREARLKVEILHNRLNAMLDLNGHGAGCSIGALVLGHDGPHVSEIEVKLADRLMYLAKQGGRRGMRMTRREAVPAFHEPVVAVAVAA